MIDKINKEKEQRNKDLEKNEKELTDAITRYSELLQNSKKYLSSSIEGLKNLYKIFILNDNYMEYKSEGLALNLKLSENVFQMWTSCKTRTFISNLKIQEFFYNLKENVYDSFLDEVSQYLGYINNHYDNPRLKPNICPKFNFPEKKEFLLCEFITLIFIICDEEYYQIGRPNTDTAFEEFIISCKINGFRHGFHIDKKITDELKISNLNYRSKKYELKYNKNSNNLDNSKNSDNFSENDPNPTTNNNKKSVNLIIYYIGKK